MAATAVWLRGDDDAAARPAARRGDAERDRQSRADRRRFGSVWIADHVAGAVLRLDRRRARAGGFRSDRWQIAITRVRDQLWASVEELPDPADRPGDERRRRPHSGAHADGRPFRVGTWPGATTSGRSRASTRCASTPPPAAVSARRRTAGVARFELGTAPVGARPRRHAPPPGPADRRAPGQHPVGLPGSGHRWRPRGTPLRGGAGRYRARPAGSRDGHADLEPVVRWVDGTGSPATRMSRGPT